MNKLMPVLLVWIFLLHCFCIDSHWEVSEYRRQVPELVQSIEAQGKEIQRLTASAERQIKSLIKICEDNDIPLAQDIRTSKWVEGPKPLTPAEFEEFREAWMLRLEAGISMMTGKPISIEDPVNGPTVALIAGLKAGRLLHATTTNAQQ